MGPERTAQGPDHRRFSGGVRHSFRGYDLARPWIRAGLERNARDWIVERVARGKHHGLRQGFAYEPGLSLPARGDDADRLSGIGLNHNGQGGSVRVDREGLLSCGRAEGPRHRGGSIFARRYPGRGDRSLAVHREREFRAHQGKIDLVLGQHLDRDDFGHHGRGLGRNELDRSNGRRARLAITGDESGHSERR